MLASIETEVVVFILDFKLSIHVKNLKGRRPEIIEMECVTSKRGEENIL